MSVHRMIWTEYSHLSDVWTNHLLPFLQPSTLHVRQHLAIVLHEMLIRMDRDETCNPRSIRRSLIHYRLFWLNECVAVLYDCWNRVHYVLHMLNNGQVHCSARWHGRNLYMSHVDLNLHQSLKYVYVSILKRIICYQLYTRDLHVRWWRAQGHQPPEETTDCACLSRTLTLLSIQNRNK